jgi:hypothetical protein
MFSMNKFIEATYPLRHMQHRDFASFLAMKGQTENTERDLFTYLLDRYIVDTKEKELWPCTEDKALRGSKQKRAFDLSIVEWSIDNPLSRRLHILEFKSNRHGKFGSAQSVETYFTKEIALDLYKMKRHYLEEGKELGTQYWQCQIFYSFFETKKVPREYATYSDYEKSSRKILLKSSLDFDDYCEERLNIFRTEVMNNAKNSMGRPFTLDTKTQKVKFEVDEKSSIFTQIAKGTHRGVKLRTDLCLLHITFD